MEGKEQRLATQAELLGASTQRLLLPYTHTALRPLEMVSRAPSSGCSKWNSSVPCLPPTQGMSDNESHCTDFVTVPMGRAWTQDPTLEGWPLSEMVPGVRALAMG